MKEIRLTQGKVALVDDEDFDLVNRYQWRFDSGYAKTGQYKDNTRHNMAELIKGVLPKGVIWDHIDTNKLNNQKLNLRESTQQQNGLNRGLNKNSTSKMKGVFLCSSTGKWRAQITPNGKKISLGRFTSLEEAALAYNKKAKELFGEFAYQNPV